MNSINVINLINVLCTLTTIHNIYTIMYVAFHSYKYFGLKMSNRVIIIRCVYIGLQELSATKLGLKISVALEHFIIVTAQPSPSQAPA